MAKKAKKTSDEETSSLTGGRKIVGVDLGSISKIVDAELTQKVYKDGLAKPVKEVGALLTDVLKGARLFTAPLVLMANYKDRLLKYLTAARDKVPEEKQVESPPEVSGPIIERLKYMDEEHPLHELFLNLLTSSIDRDKQKTIHPAFPMILSQMSADEVKLLKAVSGHAPFHVQQRFLVGLLSEDDKGVSLSEEPELNNPNMILTYIERLVSLNLVNKNHQESKVDGRKNYVLMLSHFGHDFLSGCGIEVNPKWDIGDYMVGFSPFEEH